MELALFVYAASIVSGLNGLFVAFALICMLASIIIIMISYLSTPATWDPDTLGVPNHVLSIKEQAEAGKRGQVLQEKFRGKVKWTIPLAVLFAMLAALTPDDEKQMYLIGGAWALQTVGEKTVNSETADLAVKAVNAKLKKYVTEATEETQPQEKKGK